METVTDYPHEVRKIEHEWIRLSDGTRLAARIWLPEGAENRPVPAILEYLPYRRRDGTRARDDLTHPYIAGHGYACVRVDMRGSGDSDGILHDEYLPQEQLDGVEVLNWMREQPWCDGNLGMIGISWGGFNGLQIAAHRPAGLKAIITICSTDDRYADDVHYMGGALLIDNLAWASVMYAYNFRPPDPATAGDEWRAKWLERLDCGRFWLEPWLEHQRRDGYWRQGSVCEDFSDIDCAVFAVGGWADAYSNAIPRLLEGLDSPRLGLIGPWGHRYPHMGSPGPAVGFLQESLRWWDRWLKGVETGIMDEPMLRAWVQESVPPAVQYDERPGRWVGEPAWPAATLEWRTHPLAPGRIESPGFAVAEAELPISSPLSVGLEAGAWCSYGGADLPGDQSEADQGSLIFDSEPLAERLEILGAPLVELELSSDEPVAMVAVRLSDVAPDGRATRVSYGLLNLTHRDSHSDPQPLTPGVRYRIGVKLNDVGQAFPAGHRIRVSASTSYWPLAWPSPGPTTLTLHTGSSNLRLPVREPRPDDAAVALPMPAVGAPPMPATSLEPGSKERRVSRDEESGETVLEVVSDAGRYRVDDIDLEVASRSVERYSVQGDDPRSVRGEIVWEISYRRGEWQTRTRTRTLLSSDATRFTTLGEVEAYEGDELVFERSTETHIERDLL
jgi:putative CocE/NonD family hydrolase